LPFPDGRQVADTETEFLVAGRKVVGFAVPAVPDGQRPHKRFVHVVVGLRGRLNVQIQPVFLAPHLGRLPRHASANLVRQIQLKNAINNFLFVINAVRKNLKFYKKICLFICVFAGFFFTRKKSSCLGYKLYSNCF